MMERAYNGFAVSCNSCCSCPSPVPASAITVASRNRYAMPGTVISLLAIA